MNIPTSAEVNTDKQTALMALVTGVTAGQLSARTAVVLLWNQMLARAAFAKAAARYQRVSMPSPRQFARSMGYANYAEFKRVTEAKQKAAAAELEAAAVPA